MKFNLNVGDRVMCIKDFEDDYIKGTIYRIVEIDSKTDAGKNDIILIWVERNDGVSCSFFNKLVDYYRVDILYYDYFTDLKGLRKKKLEEIDENR